MSWFLKDYVEIGRRFERERIIALLKHESPFGRKHRKDYCVTCDNIALIKGENE